MPTGQFREFSSRHILIGRKIHSKTYANKIIGVSNTPPTAFWKVNEAAGRTAVDSIHTIVSLELLDNLGFETAGAGGADIWANWNETASDGALANETTFIRSGSDAMRATAGALALTKVVPSPTPPTDGTIVVRPGTNCTLTFWTRGDGTNAGRYSVRDQTNSTNIISATTTGVAGTTYTQVTVTFSVPTTCYSIQISLFCPPTDGGICYYDDVSLIASDFPMDGIYPTAGATYGTPGIGDGNTSVTLNGSDTPILVGSRAFNTLWNGDKFSAIVWGQVDAAARWTDATTYRYLFHMRSRTDATFYAVFGKSQTDNQIAWRRRAGGVTNEQTYVFSPAGPTGWFCQGFTVDVSIPIMRGYIYAPGHTNWTRTFEVAGDGIAWGTNPIDSTDATLFAGALTAQEWIGSGALAALWNGVELTEAQMFTAMVP